MGKRTPRPVKRAMQQLGDDLRQWRHLQHLTEAQVADRAGVSRNIVSRLERGEGSTLETALRVARALGVLDQLAGAVDPLSTDLGRMRAEEQRPERVRSRTITPPSSTLRIAADEIATRTEEQT